MGGPTDRVRLDVAPVDRVADAMSAGRYEEAFASASAISPPGVVPERSPQVWQVALDLVEAAVRIGRKQDARAHVAALREAGAMPLSPRIEMVVHAAAAIAGDDADPAAPARHFEAALSVHGAQAWPFDVGRIRLAYGEYLRRHRQVAGARVQLDLAVEGFERLGERPWEERARAELRASGLGRRRSSGPDGQLTTQERTIAELAASGLSNKQIGAVLYLSPRTIGAHLYRVFPKLGIASRAALRDALDERGLTAGRRG